MNMSDTATTTLIPHLCCRNAAEAAEFYEKALGAKNLGIFKSPNGRVMHAELNVNDALFYLVDEMPEHGVLSPLALQGTPVTLYLRVADCDTFFARAVAAGCKVQTPLQDMFWGDRYGLVVDPYGHKWEIATTIRQVTNEELDEVVSSMSGRAEPARVAN
jgi:PhnB protein